jgi:predicted small secreted protein
MNEIFFKHLQILPDGPIKKGESWQMIMKMLMVLALVVVFSCIVGCNTVQGVGRDITWVGEKAGEVVH